MPSAAWLSAVAVSACNITDVAAQASAASHERVPAHLTFSLGVEHTDNVTRVETDEISDTVYSLGADFQWATRNLSRLHANIEGSLQYYEYSEAEYQPEIVGEALGMASYDIIPDFFSWNFQDSFRQVRIDAAEPVTPDNRQDANLFMTGPRIDLPLGSRNTLLTIEGQYEQANYSVSTEDSEVLLGRLALNRKMGPRATLSASATARQIDYEQDLSAFRDYDAQDYLLGWTIVGNKTMIALEAGYSFTQQSDSEHESPYFRATLSRDLTPRTTIALYATHQLTGSSDAIHFGQIGGGSGPRTSEFAVNPDPFTLNQVGLTYAFTSTRSSISIDLAAQEDRYEETIEDDRDTVSVEVQAWTMLNQVWTIGAFGGWFNEKYVERNDAESTYTDYGVFAGARVTNRIRIELSGSHSRRTTNFAASEYEENTGRLTMSYTWGEAGYSNGISMPRSTR